MTYLFTSESVSEGHPDKICDQISDAIVDAATTIDPNCRAAIECFTTTGLLVIGGETSVNLSAFQIQEIARKVILDIGYDNPDYGLDGKSCSILSALHEQSPDIAQGVNKGEGLHKDLGAGDQGMMFGYACKQTPELMPLPIQLSHKLVNELAQKRKSNEIPYLRPDAKAQVTVTYEGKAPLRVDTVVLSTQHNPDVNHETLEKDIVEKVIKTTIPDQYLDANTRYLINPTGRFVIGGPHGDTGLTGRKIIVDTYGGWAPHGGGAFSGKDCTKVDRSGAYMARYVAKNIVAAGIAAEIQIQLAYAIGVAEPVSVHVDTFGSGNIPDQQIEWLIKSQFDLTPEGIINTLNLKRPIYQQTAAYGHFGRNDIGLPWEETDKADTLAQASKAGIKLPTLL